MVITTRTAMGFRVDAEKFFEQILQHTVLGKKFDDVNELIDYLNEKAEDLGLPFTVDIYVGDYDKLHLIIEIRLDKAGRIKDRGNIQIGPDILLPDNLLELSEKIHQTRKKTKSLLGYDLDDEPVRCLLLVEEI